MIGQACAFGDRRPSNVALLALDPELGAGLDPEHSDTVAAVQREVDTANAQLSRVEQIKRFALLAEEWLPGGDGRRSPRLTRGIEKPRGYGGFVSDPEATSDPAPDDSSDDAVDPEVIEGEIVEGEIVDSEPVPVPPVDTGYTAAGVPTFDAVREKIETRFGTSIGSAELAAETPEGRSVEEQYEARQKAAADRLEQIRATMRDDEPDA